MKNGKMPKKFKHICEVCGKTEDLTAKEAYLAGWDYPPTMGEFGVISPRTCPDCVLMDTAWWAIQLGLDLTEQQKLTIKRIAAEIDETQCEYRGYRTVIRWSQTDKCYYGKLEGIKDLVLFDGDTIETCEEEFHKIVDEYTEWLQSLVETENE